jgi:serine protease Do
MRRAIAGVMVAAVCGMSGCIIVVDRDREVRYYSEDGKPSRPIGVYLAEMDRATASQLGIDRGEAALVTSVSSHSPADKGGLKAYDVITSVNGDTHASPERVRRAIQNQNAGGELHFGLLREGKPLTVCVVKP